MIKISIITPLKNGISYLKDCIESIISQQGDFYIEYLIIDGQSTDGSLELAQSYEKQISQDLIPINCKGIEMKVMSGKDHSMYEALTNGFKLCKGDVVAYLNSDDMYLPNSFRKVKYCFEHYSVNWLMGKIRTVDSELELIHQLLPFSYENDLIRHGHYNGKLLPFIQQENVFFTKECLKLIDFEVLKNHKLAGDFYIWFSLSQHYKLWVANESFAQARMHNNRLSSNRELYFKEFSRIAQKKNFSSYYKAFKWLCKQHLIPFKSKWSGTVIALPHNI